MGADLWGNPVSGDDPVMLSAIDGFANGLVAYRTDTVAILDVADRYPDQSLVQAYCGTLHLLAEAQGAEEGARPFLARAEATGVVAGRQVRNSAKAAPSWSGRAFEAGL